MYVNGCSEKLNQVKSYSEEYSCLDENIFAKGGQGSLYKIRETKTQKTLLLKISSYSGKNESEMETFREKWKDLEGQHVIKLVSYHFKKKYQKIYDIIPIIEGPSLSKIIESNPVKFKIPVFIWKVFEGIVLGTKTLHKINYIHSDLKPDNIIIDEEGDAIVIDYDSVIKSGSTGNAQSTPHFSDSLIVTQERYTYGEKTDVYSLGMTLVNMVAPSNIEKMGKTLYEIGKFLTIGKFTFPKGVLKSAVWLISRCIIDDEENRISMKELLNEINTLRKENNNDQLAEDFDFTNKQILDKNLKVIKTIEKEGEESLPNDSSYDQVKI